MISTAMQLIQQEHDDIDNNTVDQTVTGRYRNDIESMST